MALTRQQVADELNRLNQSGASDTQIANFVQANGFSTSDFNVDLSGQFRPMVLGTGTITTAPTAAEQAESNKYYESLTSSASAVSPQAAASATVTSATTTTTTTTAFQQSTGGGSTTVYAGVTTVSPEAAAAAKQANLRASAFTANPDGKFGGATIDRAVASGAITQEEATALKSGSIPAEQRFEVAAQATSEAKAAFAAGTTTTPPTTVTNVSTSSSEISVTTETVKTEAQIVTTQGEVSARVETVTENNQTYQTETNPETGEVSATPIASNPAEQKYQPTVTYTPETDTLETPPVADADYNEFEGTDTAIEANANRLEEPPVMSNEEVDQYLNNYNTDEEEAEFPEPLQEPPGTEVEDPQPEDPDVITNDDGSYSIRDTNGNWTTYDSDGNEYTPGSNPNLPQNIAQQNSAEPTPNSKATKDWRVRLRLAKSANYLYMAEGEILKPIKETDGIIFPYMPQISYSYQANYEGADLAHTNYKYYQYKNSEVTEINITAEFTAQDVKEANYMLAVIHFFRSVTKMFYGQDVNPPRGVPPPLCFLSGLGPYQFDGHPLLVRSFQYSLPNDVDYVRTGDIKTTGISLDSYAFRPASYLPGLNRLLNSGLKPGAISSPDFDKDLTRKDATYVPTKIQMVISCIPIVTRKDIATNFSLEKYAKGDLFKRGIW